MGSILGVESPKPYRVYQRTSDGAAVIEVAGNVSTNASGMVEARLVNNGVAIKGAGWTKCSLEGNKFSAVFSAVPVGGPYSLEVRVRDGEKVLEGRKVLGILVGDLWILAGQSNMDGSARMDFIEPPSKYVNCFYYGDHWGVAKDPLCLLNESVDPVHWTVAAADERAAALKLQKAFGDCGAGLGVRFGKDMYKATGVPIGLIMCSHGGTSMNQWSPELKHKGGESLYGCMIRRANAAGGKVAGCLWYQGESDAIEEAAGSYKEKFTNFIQSIRFDLGQPDLPFLYVQLAKFFTGEPVSSYWDMVQNDQLVLESEMENVAFAAAIDCTLSDAIHVDAISCRKLGSRLAKLARKMVFGEDLETGPRPGSIEFLDDKRTKIRLNFNGVNGSLTPSRGIRGFLVEKDGVGCAVRSCVRGSDGKSVIMTLASPAPEGAKLWYGRGVIPCVNLADKGGFAAPVFGPIELL